MSVPKSVVKINKDGVTYTSSVDRCNYYMFELSRAALRDASKLVKRRFRELYYQHFHKWTGKAGRVTKDVVHSSRTTATPYAEMGLKTGRNDGFYGYFQEFGTSTQPRLGLFQKAAMYPERTILAALRQDAWHEHLPGLTPLMPICPDGALQATRAEGLHCPAAEAITEYIRPRIAMIAPLSAICSTTRLMCRAALPGRCLRIILALAP